MYPRIDTTFEWIAKIVHSCTTVQHVDVANNLLEAYRRSLHKRCSDPNLHVEFARQEGHLSVLLEFKKLTVRH